METEVIISLQDSKNIEISPIRCRVEIDSKFSIIEGNSPAKIVLSFYSSTTVVSFSLLDGEEVLATAKVTFNSLVGDQRRSER